MRSAPIDLRLSGKRRLEKDAETILKQVQHRVREDNAKGITVF
jgi:hypothetical protein